MREEEKIFAGKMFNGRDPELVKLKHKAHGVASPMKNKRGLTLWLMKCA